MNKKRILRNLVPYIILLLSASQANAITAEFMEGQFEPVLNIGNVTKIEAWEQPRTQYTPKNLRSEYQIRYSGTNAQGRGSYSYTTHFTDYDTYITGNGITQDGKYYVRDNTGKGYVTGEVSKDFTPKINNLNQSISNTNNNVTKVKTQVNNVSQRVDVLNNQVSKLSDRVDILDNRLDNMNNKMKQGFATVTALTSLHPNPRSTEKLEVSIGTGVYMDTFAGAIGLFYHPNDRVQVYAGAAYGGHDSWAGGAGITFGIGRKKK